MIKILMIVIEMIFSEYLPELDYLTNADFQKEEWSDTYQEYTKNYDNLYE